MLDRRWRHGVERGLGPVGGGLRRLGIPADALTVFGLVASVVTAFLIASGHLGWAVLGVIVAGVSDLLDGAIARGSGQASPRGAFFDSVSDRVSDALLLAGTAWYLLGQGSPYLSMLAFAVGAELAGVVGALIALPLAAVYPAIERIWLGEELGEDLVREHHAIERRRAG